MKHLYKTYGHAKTNLKYHIIFSTRYRRKCLTGIHDQVIHAFQYIELKSDFNILKMELDKDHIHFLLEFKPSLSIESVVNRLKSMPTNWLYAYCYQHLKRYYWNENTLWTRGYFCSTIGEVSEKHCADILKTKDKFQHRFIGQAKDLAAFSARQG